MGEITNVCGKQELPCLYHPLLFFFWIGKDCGQLLLVHVHHVLMMPPKRRSAIKTFVANSVRRVNTTVCEPAVWAENHTIQKIGCKATNSKRIQRMPQIESSRNVSEVVMGVVNDFRRSSGRSLPFLQSPLCTFTTFLLLAQECLAAAALIQAREPTWVHACNTAALQSTIIYLQALYQVLASIFGQMVFLISAPHSTVLVCGNALRRSILTNQDRGNLPLRVSIIVGNVAALRTRRPTVSGPTRRGD